LIRQENAKQESSFEDEFAEREPQKTLKIAVIGLPNSGKSTLINQIIERRVRFDYIILYLNWTVLLKFYVFF
jgi:predicted GTPase